MTNQCKYILNIFKCYLFQYPEQIFTWDNILTVTKDQQYVLFIYHNNLITEFPSNDYIQHC
jgi:hypothetical protein